MSEKKDRPYQVPLSQRQLEKLRSNKTLHLEHRQHPKTNEVIICTPQDRIRQLSIVPYYERRAFDGTIVRMGMQIVDETGRALTETARYPNISPLHEHDADHPFSFYQVVIAERGAIWNILLWNEKDQKFIEVGEDYHSITLHPEFGYRLIGKIDQITHFIDPTTGLPIHRTKLNGYKGRYRYQLTGDDIRIYERETYIETIPLLAIPPVEPIILYSAEKKSSQTLWAKIKSKLQRDL